MDLLSVACIDTNVCDLPTISPEDEVTRLEIRTADPAAGSVLGIGTVRQADTCSSVCS